MSQFKRRIANFSFYDQKTIEKELEQMAANGWMLCKASNLFWTYEKMQPQKLRFAVTYFPGASELDPSPSERQLYKEEFCAQEGWRLVLRWDAMQIFCTDREDAVPIETDPVPQVANIDKTMRKKLLTGQGVMIIAILWFLFIQLSDLHRDPVDYLSSNNHLFGIPLWLLLLFANIFELCSYFRWQKKARKAAEDGIFLPVRTNKVLAWGIVALAALFLIVVYSESSTHLVFTLCFAAVMGLIYFLCSKLMGWLKKKGLPRQLNILKGRLIFGTGDKLTIGL